MTLSCFLKVFPPIVCEQVVALEVLQCLLRKYQRTISAEPDSTHFDIVLQPLLPGSIQLLIPTLLSDTSVKGRVLLNPYEQKRATKDSKRQHVS